MAQTDAKAGFRLPWNTERSTSEQTEVEQAEAVQAETEQADAPAAGPDWGTVDAGASTDSKAPTGEPGQEAPDEVIDEATEIAASAEAATSPNAPRKQTKFMSDLTKAMQVAAEDARNRTLAAFQGDAKTYIEQIHARSATESAELRRQADDDVASVREWSKAEIARVREETEAKISARKARLEGEVDGHGAKIEREIELVSARVTNFEEEMAAFFTRLLAEQDPMHFATMAERLPEPDPFEEMGVESAGVASTRSDATQVAEVVKSDEAAAVADAPVEGAVETVESQQSYDTVEAHAETAGGADHAEATATAEEPELDREAAFAAIQAAAEAAASAEGTADAAPEEAAADVAIEVVADQPDEADEANAMRVAALGLSPDYDAAEAEAAQAADSSSDSEEIPEIGDDALAARLAGLVPGKGDGKSRSSETKSTQVVVVGLVSVASIASFKRHLGRLTGVQSVGVSSGPDGEFLFAVNHSADVVLRDAVPSMPSFQARVTGAGDGTLNVSAHDPESDN